MRRIGYTLLCCLLTLASCGDKDPVIVPVEGLAVEPARLEAEVGGTGTLVAQITPENATDKTVFWSSGDESIATVVDGVVTGLKTGRTTILARTGPFEASCAVTVGVLTEAVDLGLGVQWANKNLGACTPTEYGDYFAWGETQVKDTYTDASYQWKKDGKLTRYCALAATDLWYGNTTPDEWVVLDAEDDAARVYLGDGWRMPTREEQEALKKECKVSKEELDGVAGFRVTGPNGNSIFIPASGRKSEKGLEFDGKYAYLWSSSLYTTVSTSAHSYNLLAGMAICGFSDRAIGLPVRPVKAE